MTQGYNVCKCLCKCLKSWYHSFSPTDWPAVWGCTCYMVMSSTSLLSTGMQFRKQAKSLTTCKLLLVHPQEKCSHSLTFCKSSSVYCICNYACSAMGSHQTSWQTSSGLVCCSELLKSDQVAQARESTASLGSQSQCFITLIMKNILPASSWNIPFCDLCPLPLTPLLHTCVWLSRVCNFDCRRLQLDCPVAFSSKGRRNPVLSVSLYNPYGADPQPSP